MLQMGVMDELQKAKQVQAMVNLLIQSCWLPAWHKPVSKIKTARRQSLQMSSWADGLKYTTPRSLE